MEELTTKECKERSSHMEIKHGSWGMFWGCQNYPHCSYTENYVVNISTEKEKRKMKGFPKIISGKDVKKKAKFRAIINNDMEVTVTSKRTLKDAETTVYYLTLLNGELLQKDIPLGIFINENTFWDRRINYVPLRRKSDVNNRRKYK